MGCWGGCVVILVGAIAAIVLGYRVVGQAAGFAVLAITLAQTLHQGQFYSLFRSRPLRRDAQPALYWAVALLFAAFAIMALWLLVEEVQALADQ
jgi:hypothetical protein